MLLTDGFGQAGLATVPNVSGPTLTHRDLIQQVAASVLPAVQTASVLTPRACNIN
ncbi:hypothetical protein DPMN_030843 [Dreissena polymorpha]|uniref:Uncharacterized protein n=1 Tax=Dreissena polymorpha TaxID=45954 RepID=A0A9D4LYV7_DREPO|nr:hypothetical protein DPMN_030843 [Dreissena polymorpha]